MTPANLARYARALTCSGDRWRRPLAYLLKVDPRTVRRWADENDDTPIPDWVERRLRELAEERRRELEEVAS